jgi:ribosomal-protein-alanine N-acetyltransferase
MNESSTTNFEIAPATWRDFREILALERRCFTRDPWPWIDVLAALTFPETVRLKAVTPPADGPAAEADGVRPVGFVIGDRKPREHLGWIASIGVDPNYQRRGIGWELLRACERELGMPSVRLTLRQSNRGAWLLYNRAGYVEIDRALRYYNDGEDAIVMEKRVGAPA